MTDDVDPLGRREIDKYGALAPEVLHVLLVQVQSTLTKLEATVEKGFDRLAVQLDQMEKRVTALEGFRERVQERDRAIAKAEGQFHLSWQALTAIIAVMSVVIGIVMALISH